MLNLHNYTRTKPKPIVDCKNCSHVCVWLSVHTTVRHNTAQNSSNDFPSYPPDDHHSSDVVWIFQLLFPTDFVSLTETRNTAAMCARPLCNAFKWLSNFHHKQLSIHLETWRWTFVYSFKTLRTYQSSNVNHHHHHHPHDSPLSGQNMNDGISEELKKISMACLRLSMVVRLMPWIFVR